jgi:hypothetical protein
LASLESRRDLNLRKVQSLAFFSQQPTQGSAKFDEFDVRIRQIKEVLDSAFHSSVFQLFHSLAFGEFS